MDYGRWQLLMEKFQISSNQDMFEALVSAYGEKHRFYHNENHVDNVLEQLDAVSEEADSPHEIELALWFHDAIYNPFSTSNELDSANWASEFLLSNNRPEQVAERVHQLIMATLHKGKQGDPDEELMVDIDLTILGAKKSVYDEYEKNIRKEYELVPILVYKSRRKEILAGFLARDRIFKNNYFYEKFERQARINLKNAIKAL